MTVVSCPKCGRPRAKGHPCPSCGDRSVALAAPSATTPSAPSAAVESKSGVAHKRSIFFGRLKDGVDPSPSDIPATSGLRPPEEQTPIAEGREHRSLPAFSCVVKQPAGCLADVF